MLDSVVSESLLLHINYLLCPSHVRRYVDQIMMLGDTSMFCHFGIVAKVLKLFTSFLKLTAYG